MKDTILSRLRPGAIQAGCRAFSGRMVKVPSASVYYPDVLIVCGKAGDRLFETDASLVVEVASPSTRTTDRREKLLAYSELPSLTLYVLVEPGHRHIEAAAPDSAGLSWRTYGPGEVIDTAYGPLGVDDLYDEVDTQATID